MQNIVIAGFGFMGGMHAQVYAQLPDAKLVAIVDGNQSAAEANLKKLGLDLPIYPTLEEALAKHSFEVVDICLPTPAHGAYVRQALKLGKAIFCEKPFAATAKEAAALAAAMAKAKVKAQVGQCLRFWPEYQAFVEFVRKKSAGKLLSLSMQRRSARPGYSIGNWLNQGRLSGGAALDLHIHDTDFVHHLLGKPKAVTAVGTKDASGWSHIFTTYHFKGLAVTAEGGWNYPSKWGFQMAFQAVFEKGTVEYDSSANPTLTVTLGDEARQPLPYTQPSAGESSLGSGNVSSLGGYFNELASFVADLEHGRMPKLATPRQAAESVRTVNAEIRSLQTGRTVKL
jgi:predicted dehydrogenase